MGKRIYLENSAGKHHKFYEVVVQDREVHLRWGRIGSEGQRLLCLSETAALAQNVARDKIAEKLRHGYVRKRVPSKRKPVEQPHPRQIAWGWSE